MAGSSSYWRPMEPGDLPCVVAMAEVVHPAYPESPEVFQDRLSLYAPGCLVFEVRNQPVGYAISHPWRRGRPPALNAVLGALPAPASTYYLHDIALLPEARGQRAPAALLALLLPLADRAGVSDLSLVAVNGSRRYWETQQFVVIDEPALREKLRSYDADACFMSRALI